MTGFTVTPDSLPPLADQLRQVATDLVAQWGPVREQSLAVHFGRGDDMVSPLIQISIQGAVALLDSCVSTSADALNGYATGLEKMAKTFGENEQNIVTLIKAKQ